MNNYLLKISTFALTQIFATLSYAVPQDWNYSELHAYNAFVAKFINTHDIKFYEDVAGQLKNNEDKDYFKKVFADLKGKNIKAYPLFENLILNNGKDTFFIRIESIKPLRVSFNNQKIQQIDIEKIKKSLDKKISANWPLDIFLPTSHAFLGFGSDDSDKWLFLYAAVNPKYTYNNEYKPYSSESKYNNPDKNLAKDISDLLKFYNIASINCKAKETAQNNLFGKEEPTAFTFKSKDNKSYILACSRPPYCKIKQASKVKDNWQLTDEYDEEHDAKTSIKNFLIGKLRSKDVGDDAELDAKHLHINHGMFDDKISIEIDSKYTNKYSKKTVDAIKNFNLEKYADTLGKSKSGEKSLKDLINEYRNKRIRSLAASGGGKEALNNGAMYPLVKCCKMEKCRKEALQEAGFKMEGDAAEISQ